MSEVVYVSKIKIERRHGPLRIAYLPWRAATGYFQCARCDREALQGRPKKLENPTRQLWTM
jgi:hypothetical protein